VSSGTYIPKSDVLRLSPPHRTAPHVTAEWSDEVSKAAEAPQEHYTSPWNTYISPHHVYVSQCTACTTIPLHLGIRIPIFAACFSSIYAPWYPMLWLKRLNVCLYGNVQHAFWCVESFQHTRSIHQLSNFIHSSSFIVHAQTQQVGSIKGFLSVCDNELPTETFSRKRSMATTWQEHKISNVIAFIITDKYNYWLHISDIVLCND